MINIYKSLRAYYFYMMNYWIMKRHNVDFKSDFRVLGKMIIQNKGMFSIGNDYRCNAGQVYNPIGGDSDCRFIVREKAVLKIGDSVGISNTTIVATNKIVIEDNVLIGGSCKIWDTDFHSLDPYIRIKENDSIVITKPIKISENAFIGAHCIILKGVEIGKNSVIGAGSVVSKSIPENEVWAGNPIRFIRKVDQIKALES